MMDDICAIHDPRSGSGGYHGLGPSSCRVMRAHVSKFECGINHLVFYV